MDRKDRLKFSKAVTWAAQDGSPISGIRRSQTMPVDLRAVEDRRASNAIPRHAQTIAPNSDRLASNAERPKASPNERRAKVSTAITLPRKNSNPLVEAYDGNLIADLSPVDVSDAISQAEERRAAKRRYIQPYVESISEDDQPAVEFVRSGSVLESVHEGNEEGHGHGLDDQSQGLYEEGFESVVPTSTEIERRIARLEAERRELRKARREEEERQRLEEAQLEVEMRRRLGAAGFTADQIKTITDKEKAKREPRQVYEEHPRQIPLKQQRRVPEKQQHLTILNRRRPTYVKVHKKYLSVDTLRYYDIPWEYDRVITSFVIV